MLRQLVRRWHDRKIILALLFNNLFEFPWRRVRHLEMKKAVDMTLWAKELLCKNVFSRHHTQPMCRNNWNNHCLSSILYSSCWQLLIIWGTPVVFPVAKDLTEDWCCWSSAGSRKNYGFMNRTPLFSVLLIVFHGFSKQKNTNAKVVNRPRFLWFHREKSPSKLYRSTGSNNPNYLILEFADLE